MYMNVLFHLFRVCVCTACVPGARGGQKRARDSSGSAFIHIVSHHVGAGNPFLGLLEEQQML